MYFKNPARINVCKKVLNCFICRLTRNPICFSSDLIARDLLQLSSLNSCRRYLLAYSFVWDSMRPGRFLLIFLLPLAYRAQMRAGRASSCFAIGDLRGGPRYHGNSPLIDLGFPSMCPQIRGRQVSWTPSPPLELLMRLPEPALWVTSWNVPAIRWRRRVKAYSLSLSLWFNPHYRFPINFSSEFTVIYRLLKAH